MCHSMKPVKTKVNSQQCNNISNEAIPLQRVYFKVIIDPGVTDKLNGLHEYTENNIFNFL